MTNTPATLTSPALPTIRADRRVWIIVSLLILYIVWGTTYLVIRFALEGFTPYWLMALRFLIAGGVLYIFLRLRGVPNPTLKQWRSATIVGALLLGGGMGSVALAEESISSGLAAALVATAPLWAILYSRLWGRIPERSEWIGVIVGLVGVALLTLEGNLQANPQGLLLLLIAPALWSLGSVWMKHLDMPADGFMGSAAEMLMGGLVLCGLALLRGEPFPTSPTPGSIAALIYLIVLGSLLTMTAYTFLLRTVSPALATSYSFVNPAIALLLGVALGGEQLTGSALIALPVILVGVAFVFRTKKGA
ncbi:MAG: drug/metabolite exporter YedA [Chloroflexota bacterium]|nr:drug/metabolite exporter YedA [Chloroflexota bacterium]